MEKTKRPMAVSPPPGAHHDKGKTGTLLRQGYGGQKGKTTNDTKIHDIDGIASVRNVVKGSFETIHGPWVPGVNMLVLNAFELDPFKSALAGYLPVNRTEGAKPVINTVFDETTRVYDEITGTDLFSIAGSDLAPDATKEDEYVALVSSAGVETKAEIEFSDLQNVKARLASALPAGQYTLKVFTRSGFGEDFGVRVATKRVTVA